MSFDEYERDKIRLRTMEGRLQRTRDEKRRPVGRPSNGFGRIKDGETGVVVAIFPKSRDGALDGAKRLAGWSCGEIARDLNTRACRAGRSPSRRVVHGAIVSSAGAWDPSERSAGRSCVLQPDRHSHPQGRPSMRAVCTARCGPDTGPADPVGRDVSSRASQHDRRRGRPCGTSGSPRYILRGKLWCPEAARRSRPWARSGGIMRATHATGRRRAGSASRRCGWRASSWTASRESCESGLPRCEAPEDELRPGVTEVVVRSAVSYLEGKLAEDLQRDRRHGPIAGQCRLPANGAATELQAADRPAGGSDRPALTTGKLGRLTPDLKDVHAAAKLFRQTLDQLATADDAGWAELIGGLAARITVYPDKRFELDGFLGTGLQNVHQASADSTCRRSSVLQEVPSADDKPVSPRQTALPSSASGSIWPDDDQSAYPMLARCARHQLREDSPMYRHLPSQHRLARTCARICC